MMPEESRDTSDASDDDSTCAAWDFGRDLAGEAEMADLLDEGEDE